MLVGGRYLDDLDEPVDLSGDPEISFVRLVALVG
jgi:hypothetical protein